MRRTDLAERLLSALTSGIGAFLAATVMTLSTAHAEADGPDFLRVTGVREGGSLNVSAAGSGSGSRYAAADALGEYAFWIKGDEARFDQPGEDALACSITKPG